jgi:hypothetical protein
MVFLAFISVKFETSKFSRVNICQNLLASEFFAIIVKDVANKFVIPGDSDWYSRPYIFFILRKKYSKPYIFVNRL